MKYFIFASLITLSSMAFADELKVGVKGMVCAFCAQGIEKSFMSQKEVAGIDVSLANKFVKIKFKDGQTLSHEKITQLLKDSGYDASFEK
ncbi:heavy-metal-associated domain-containing protein [Bdellovibrio sp. HCB337]|uniref:heavy-metal-associated domain-containing protein n=1 Tax=Bdellovibrio sp. HCB337 TaxID=3394358 RepID=UPI0039A427D9